MPSYLSRGDSIEGYSVVDEGSAGTTGIVYRVTKGGSDFALKLFTGSLTSDQKTRFLREGSLLCQLIHPHIARGYHISSIPGEDRPFLILEYINGPPLTRYYRDRTSGEALFPAADAIRIIREVVSALHYALAEHHVVHRDLKLENVLIEIATGSAKLIDFGLARRVDEIEKLPSSWEVNAAPRYRPPEKWRDFHQADERADVWSLGVILYYLLTGRFPFVTPHVTGSEYQLMDLVLHSSPPPPSRVNPKITQEHDALVRAMLAVNPSARPRFAELLKGLSVPSTELISSIAEAFWQRGTEYSHLSFEPEAARHLLASADVIGLLVSNTFLTSFRGVCAMLRMRLLERLLACHVRWGPSFRSPRRKVANVAEVLLCMDDEFLSAGSGRKEVVAETAQWLAKQEQDDGYPSLSYELVTTQCTALAALMFDHLSSLTSFDSESREWWRELSTRAAQKCLSLAGERGWATWAEGEIRIQPTIWALRALALQPEQFREEILRRFDSLRAMHSLRHPGCFGFRPGTDPRVSPTASFLLLCAELESSGLISGQSHLPFQRYNAFRYLIEGARRGGFWSSENESYYVAPAIAARLGNVEQVPWYHISGPLALQAIASSSSMMGLGDDTITWFRAATELIQRAWPTGIVDDSVLAEAGLQDPLFPSTYACVALAAAERWAEQLRQGPVIPPLPPPPEVLGNIIHKVGGAILESGRLLLVRKFGGDQLIMPGGAKDGNESDREALVRELIEELGVEPCTVGRHLGIFRAPAAFEKGVEVEISLYEVTLSGAPRPSSEIEALVWYTPRQVGVSLSPIVEAHIVPALVRAGLLGNT